MSRKSLLATATVQVGPIEVEVQYSAYDDPGKTYGPPEDCYPPDREMEILSVTCCGDDVMPLLSERAMEIVEEKCWEHFSDVESDGYDYERDDFLYDCAREDRVFGR